jgi:Asp-tRNA(Asn)/Glu-tRNA(Gln) amidotransferase A subunit family amidase
LRYERLEQLLSAERSRKIHSERSERELIMKDERANELATNQNNSILTLMQDAKRLEEENNALKAELNSLKGIVFFLKDLKNLKFLKFQPKCQNHSMLMIKSHRRLRAFRGTRKRLM